MAKKSTLSEVSARLGKVAGKADRRARKFVKAGSVAKEELEAIGKQVEALRKQLEKTAHRLKKALR